MVKLEGGGLRENHKNWEETKGFHSKEFALKALHTLFSLELFFCFFGSLYKAEGSWLYYKWLILNFLSLDVSQYLSTLLHFVSLRVYDCWTYNISSMSAVELEISIREAF